MKAKYLFIILLLFTGYTVKSQWMYSLDDAKKLAIATDKLVLVDFTASWCAPCKAMDKDTWNKKTIKDLMNAFIAVKIDVSSDRSTANLYAVHSIPNIFILDGLGEIIFQTNGYKDERKMKEIVAPYAISMKYMQESLIDYYKHQNGENALRIAEKYMDFSFFIDEKLKLYFLGLSNKYIKKGKKHYKKAGKTKITKQRIVLLNLYIKLIKKQYKDVLTGLLEISENEKIKDDNKTLYSFLNYAVYVKMNDRDNQKKWYLELKKNNKYKEYVFKARRI